MSGFVERVWTSADGLALSARDYAGAAGPARLPVVCVHGLTRNARDFEAVAPAVAAEGRRVLAVDVRGRGRSAWDPNPAAYNPAVYAADAAALAQAAGIARAVFVGTSMGGLTIAALAAQAPALVAAAVINDVGPVIAPAGLARILAYAGGSAEADDWAAAAAYARKTNGVAFPDYGPDDWHRFARRLFRADAHGRLRLDYDPAITRAVADPAAAPAPDLWPLFALLLSSRPALVVRGALSDVLDRDTFDAMARLGPGVSTVEVPRIGHAPTLEEPAAMTALARFLDTLP